MNEFSSAAYEALYHASGLADFSRRGKIRVTGKDRITVLHRLLTQDVRPLSPGTAQASALLNARGKVLSLMNVLIFDDHVLLDTDEHCLESTFSALSKLIITEDAVLEIERGLSHLGLQGPGASKILVSLGISAAQGPEKFFRHHSFSWKEYRGVLLQKAADSFDFLIPSDKQEAFRTELLQAGSAGNLQAVNSATWEVFRIEQGLLVFGKDVTEEVTLPETGLDRRLASDTKGCYPGQEVVARTNTYKGHTKKLRALIFKAPQIPAAGAKIFSGGVEAGWITSACVSPRHKAVLALAYLHRNFFEAPAEKEFDGAEGKIKADVLSLEDLTRKN